MVFTTFIKCQICGFITRVRLQVGQQEEHPIEVACGKCGTSLSGSVKIGQDRPGLSFSFDNADEVQDENSDYIKLTKASRYHFCLDSEDYTGFFENPRECEIEKCYRFIMMLNTIPQTS